MCACRCPSPSSSSCTAALPPSMVFAAAAATRIIGKEGTLLSEARDNIVIVDDVACPLLVALHVLYLFYILSKMQFIYCRPILSAALIQLIRR